MLRWLNRLLRYAGVVLATYWVLIFVGTHLPQQRTAPPPWVAFDKTFHFAGYAGLAFLFAAFWTRRRSLGAMEYLLILFAMSFYAAADELTQALPFIGRHCDFWDWIADVSGATLGLATFFAVSRLAKFALGWRLARDAQALVPAATPPPPTANQPEPATSAEREPVAAGIDAD